MSDSWCEPPGELGPFCMCAFCQSACASFLQVIQLPPNVIGWDLKCAVGVNSCVVDSDRFATSIDLPRERQVLNKTGAQIQRP